MQEKGNSIFNPRDNTTAGCTKQAMWFSRALSSIHQKGAVVLGVSRIRWSLTRNLKKNMDWHFTFWQIQERDRDEAYDVMERREKSWQESSLWGSGKNHMSY